MGNLGHFPSVAQLCMPEMLKSEENTNGQMVREREADRQGGN